MGNFTITKNKLSDPSMCGVTLENKDYRIRFFYSGDYAKDIASKKIDGKSITMSCTVKTRRTPELAYYDRKIMIKNNTPPILFTEDVQEYADGMRKGLAAAKELMEYHDQFFPRNETE